MTLGNSRPRNGGKDFQVGRLAVVLRRHRLAYKVDNGLLYLTGAHNGVQLPFTESCAVLVHVRRGHWEAQHRFDGRLLAPGVSIRDCVRATIEAIQAGVR